MTLPRAALITPGVLVRPKKWAVLSANIFFLQILNDFDNIRGKVPSSMFTVGVDILLPAELENLFACFKVEAGAWSIAEFLLQACCIVRCFNCAQFGQASKHAKLRKSIQGRC